MGRHMVDKTWPGVRSSAAEEEEQGREQEKQEEGKWKMKHDSLPPAYSEYGCQATIDPLFNSLWPDQCQVLIKYATHNRL